MKQLFILIATIVASIMLFSACTNEVDSSSKSFDFQSSVISPEDSLNNDPLIISLAELNDSLTIAAKTKNVQTKGLREIFGFFKLVEIVYLDVCGGIKGAQWGAVGGLAGSIVGGIVVAIGTSALASCNFSHSSVTKASDIHYYSQHQVESAYVVARQNKVLQQKEIEKCSAINLQLPVKFESSKEVGLYHNISLRILNDELPSQAELGNYLSDEEISILHSESFMNNYDALLTSPQLLSMEYLNETSDKEDRIIKLFLDVYQEYPEDMEDVNYLINMYIDRIERDPAITDLQKQCVYSALSIAAYSTNYWSNQ